MAPSSVSRAFTLVELLVVIAIIGLLSTIAVAAVNDVRAKTRDAKRVSDLKQIQKALELSYEPGLGYPVVPAPTVIGTEATDVLCGLGTSTAFQPDQTAGHCDDGKVYMGLVPANPTPGGEAYTYRSTDGTGAACTMAPCEGYCVQTILEKGIAAGRLSAGQVVILPGAFEDGSCP